MAAEADVSIPLEGFIALQRPQLVGEEQEQGHCVSIPLEGFIALQHDGMTARLQVDDWFQSLLRDSSRCSPSDDPPNDPDPFCFNPS